jgi:serine O-acetyltransferase
MSVNSETGFWKKDRTRYGRMAWLVQPSYWAVMVYRFGRWTKLTDHPLRKPAHAIYFVAYSLTRLITGIDIPRGAAIGPGLLIHHFGGIIINPGAVIGANCTMRQGVTIGTKHDGGGLPILEDNVVLGAYAQVLGPVVVGTGATVGAMSLVIIDVPRGSTAVGVPAKVVSPRT